MQIPKKGLLISGTEIASETIGRRQKFPNYKELGYDEVIRRGQEIEPANCRGF